MKLKSCPFCGGEAFDCKDGTVYCVKCECIMKSHKSWNTRPKLSEEKVADIIKSKYWISYGHENMKETFSYQLAKAICNTEDIYET